MSGAGQYRVDAIFDDAYQSLPEQLAGTYRALGLYPGGNVIPSAMARLLDRSLVESTADLLALEDVHLVDGVGDERFRMHELVAHHARTCAMRTGSADAREAALRRLIDWFYAALQRADRAVYVDRLRVTTAELQLAPDLPALSSPRQAFEWFAQDSAALVAAIRAVVAMDWDERVWQFAEALWPLCYNLKSYAVWFEVYEAGAVAAARQGNEAMVARLRSCLARAYSDQGDFGRAAQEMAIAVAAAERCDHELLKASVAEFDGIMAYERGDAAAALGLFRRGLAMYAALDSERGVALMNYHLGKCFIALAAHQQAVAPLEMAEATFRALADDVLLGRAYRRQGEAFQGLGRLNAAANCFLSALEVAERLTLPFDEAQTLEALASVAQLQGDMTAATAHLQHACRLYDELGHPRAKTLLVSLGQRAATGA